MREFTAWPVEDVIGYIWDCPYCGKESFRKKSPYFENYITCEHCRKAIKCSNSEM